MAKDLEDGEVAYAQGSAAEPYALKNTGGVYSCTCPAWRNQSATIDKRTCKHLKALRGEARELERIGAGSSSGGAHAAAIDVESPSSPKANKKGPPILLAHRWESHVDVTGWWMSEKLDGVRAYWNGKTFVSRLGNTYHAPDWFVRDLGDEPLDGELWVGRKRFQETVSIVRRADKSPDWKRVSYVLFDAPSHEGPFEKRLDWLRDRFDKGAHDHAHYLAHERCDGIEHLRKELSRIESLGGEGVMVRKPGSRYVAGRSATLLKVKSFFDAEARVVRHIGGAGKHKGRLGALEAELPSGVRFSVGTGFSDAEREAPPAIGAVITFRYQELSKDGVPRFPSFVCVRHDFEWPGG